MRDIARTPVASLFESHTKPNKMKLQNYKVCREQVSGALIFRPELSCSEETLLLLQTRVFTLNLITV